MLCVQLWTASLCTFYNSIFHVCAGMNSIVVYFCHSIFWQILPIAWEVELLHWKLLLQDVWGVSFWVIVAYILFRKKIFVALWTECQRSAIVWMFISCAQSATVDEYQSEIAVSLPVTEDSKRARQFLDPISIDPGYYWKKNSLGAWSMIHKITVERFLLLYDN